MLINFKVIWKSIFIQFKVIQDDKYQYSIRFKYENLESSKIIFNYLMDNVLDQHYGNINFNFCKYFKF